MYEADLVNRSIYEKEIIIGLEMETDLPLPMGVYWKSIEEIEKEGVPLFPELLKELLGE